MIINIKKMPYKRAYKPCAPGKERNPLTNRCRKPPTRKPSTRKPPTRKPPTRKPSTQIRNPQIWCELTQTDVRRMIVFFGMSRDLRISDIPTPNNPNKLCDTFKKMFKAPCIKNWEIVKYIGSGLHGQVYSCNHRDGRTGVVKIQYGKSPDIAQELLMQKKFQKIGAAPKILDYCSFSPNVVMGNHWKQIAEAIGENVRFSDYSRSNKIHLIFMEAVDGVYTPWLAERRDQKILRSFIVAFIVLVNTLKKNNLSHFDLHPSNLGYRYIDDNKLKVELVPIDFGLASSQTSQTSQTNTELEILKFLKSLSRKYINIHPENIKYLVDTTRRVASGIYKILIPKSQSQMESRYLRLNQK